MNTLLFILLAAAQSSAALQDAITLQEQQLRNLEHQATDSAGVYSRKLAEGYLNYSALLGRAERFDDAVEALQNALHLEKINSGPWALIDSNALRNLALMQARHGHWDDADDSIDYLLWLYQRHERQMDASLAGLLNEMASIYMIAGRHHRSTERLERAYDLYVESLHYHRARPLTAEGYPWKSLIAVNYQLQNLYEGRMRTPTISVNNSRPQQMQSSRQIPASDSDALYWRALRHLRAYRTRARKAENTRAMAEADLLIGDWHLLNDQLSRARSSYMKAWQNMDDSLRSHLATPTLLPLDGKAGTTRVSVHLSISRKGRAKVIKTSPPPRCRDDGRDGQAQKDTEFCARNKRHNRLARAIAKSSYFRPAIVDGRLVDSKDLVIPIPLDTES